MGPFSAPIREPGKFVALIFIYCRLIFFGKDERKISWGGGRGGGGSRYLGWPFFAKLCK